jgi:hypothetical protein
MGEEKKGGTSMEAIVKAKHLENEFFYKRDLELIQERLEAERLKAEAEEAQRLKELHWMRCPKCGQELHDLQCDGHAVAKCKACKGVFLEAPEVALLPYQEPTSPSFLTTLHHLLVGESRS